MALNIRKHILCQKELFTLLLEQSRSASELPKLKSNIKIDDKNIEIKANDQVLPEPIRPSIYPETVEHLGERTVRISKPSKNVMQSGTAYMKNWKIEFDSQKRYQDWVMGWTSTQDPLSNLTISFPDKESAIAYCEKNNLHWILEEQSSRQIRKKSYADNYSWDKRTRTSNK